MSRRREALELCSLEGDPDEVVAWGVAVESPRIDAGAWSWRGWVLVALCRTPARASRLVRSELELERAAALVVIRRRYARSSPGDLLGASWVRAHRCELEEVGDG